MASNHGVVQMLGSENRMLRQKIGQMEQAQKESMFIEMLTSAAVTGLVQRPELTTDQVAEQAIEIADKIMTKVMAMSQAANEGLKAVENEELPGGGEALAEEEPSLILKP